MLLKNKVAIITGSARGLGKAHALRFIKEGAKVTVCDIRDCSQVASEIKALGGDVLALKVDITSEKDTLEMAKKTAEMFGRIDVLVNNAGATSDVLGSFEQLKASDWDMMLNVNLKGTFLASKAVVPYMKKQNKGTIINIASTTAFEGAPHFMHYSASKAGVINMTRTMAKALGDFNINVNAIAPGFVMTEKAAEAVSKKRQQELIATQCIKRAVTPEDISAAVAFLASDDASIITGQTLGVNAGEYMH
jgi:3-oxoacyl-[acyl-carrier protein] reductase